MKSPCLALCLFLIAGATQAETSLPPVQLAEEPALKNPPSPEAVTFWQRLRRCDDRNDRSDRSRGWLRHFASNDQPPSPVFGTPCDVDWHKPMFILPYTYSPDYESKETEVLFIVSAKFRPLGLPLYLAYSQRSYWALYDQKRSRPFRETIYNPEIFYRWKPKTDVEPDLAHDLIWGFDGGYEHESNGQDIPASRSWDRLYIAPFLERRGTALQLKVWYRLPEDEKRDEDDAGGDDNPDIDDFMGYGELHLYRRFNLNRRMHAMLRSNPATGRGAIQVEHSWRIGEGDLFWTVYAWHGYGESLTDYNDSVTRIGIGFALAR
ncbi:MAG: phospholipase A [Panacagrimonas sp.]